MPQLCVNIDHVATVRQARRTIEPDPLAAALLAELGGASGITCHLREDRRHINDEDALRLKTSVRTRLNLEMAPTEEMLSFAEKLRPAMVMFVPERRQEVTTEGGLDVDGQRGRIREATSRMREAGLRVSHFIDPDFRQIDASLECGAEVVELHTGSYANADSMELRLGELAKLEAAALHAGMSGELQVNAGHGLKIGNVAPIAAISGLAELHIGHSIVSHAVLVGFQSATSQMVEALDRAEWLSRTHTPAEILRRY